MAKKESTKTSIMPMMNPGPILLPPKGMIKVISSTIAIAANAAPMVANVPAVRE